MLHRMRLDDLTKPISGAFRTGPSTRQRLYCPLYERDVVVQLERHVLSSGELGQAVDVVSCSACEPFRVDCDRVCLG